MDASRIAVEFWDNAYAGGMYEGAEPDAFVQDILAAAPTGASGVEVGCGSGRNLVPLVRGGLDLIGVDPSRKALDRLAAKEPGLTLIHGSQDALPAGRVYDLVVGIQVHQHGTREDARALLRGSLERVAPGGLFALRTASAATEAVEAHEVLDVTKDGGRTFRYLEGFKAGLVVHYYGRLELENLLRGCTPVLPLRETRTPRREPPPGVWGHWETIVRKPGVRDQA